jgi:hypothetical protein
MMREIKRKGLHMLVSTARHDRDTSRLYYKGKVLEIPNHIEGLDASQKKENKQEEEVLGF